MSKGPMGGGPRGGKQLYAGGGLKALDKNSVKRLLSYLGDYKARMVVVFFCIIISALAGVASSLFMRSLIDDYIAPLLLEAAPVYTELLNAITTMACIFVAGILASFFSNRARLARICALSAPV